MNITIVGSGRIGTTIGGLWGRAGHNVTLTFARDGEKLARAATEIGARAAQPAEAGAGADAVLLAIPFVAIEEALAALGPLTGTVLIDATNGGGQSGGPSGAERIAALAPKARVVKAVNTVFAPMFPEAAAHPGRASMVICGDDAEAKTSVTTLMRDCGFEAVDAGALAVAGDIEAFARLVIGIAYRQGRGPFAYRFAPPDQL